MPHFESVYLKNFEYDVSVSISTEEGQNNNTETKKEKRKMKTFFWTDIGSHIFNFFIRAINTWTMTSYVWHSTLQYTSTSTFYARI